MIDRKQFRVTLDEVENWLETENYPKDSLNHNIYLLFVDAIKTVIPSKGILTSVLVAYAQALVNHGDSKTLEEKDFDTAIHNLHEIVEDALISKNRMAGLFSTFQHILMGEKHTNSLTEDEWYEYLVMYNFLTESNEIDPEFEEIFSEKITILKKRFK